MSGKESRKVPTLLNVMTRGIVWNFEDCILKYLDPACDIKICLPKELFNVIQCGDKQSEVFVNPMDIKKCLLYADELCWTEVHLQLYEWQYDYIDEDLFIEFVSVYQVSKYFEELRLIFITFKHLNQNIIDALNTMKDSLKMLRLSYFSRDGTLILEETYAELKYLKMKRIGFGFKDEGLKINLQVFVKLEILVIEDEYLSLDMLLNIKKLEMITYLELRNVTIENYNEDIFCDVLASLKELQYLHLRKLKFITARILRTALENYTLTEIHLFESRVALNEIDIRLPPGRGKLQILNLVKATIMGGNNDFSHLAETVFMFEDGQFDHMNYLKFIGMSQYHMAVDDKLEYFLNDISSDEIPRLEKILIMALKEYFHYDNVREAVQWYATNFESCSSKLLLDVAFTLVCISDYDYNQDKVYKKDIDVMLQNEKMVTEIIGYFVNSSDYNNKNICKKMMNAIVRHCDYKDLTFANNTGLLKFCEGVISKKGIDSEARNMAEKIINDINNCHQQLSSTLTVSE